MKELNGNKPTLLNEILPDKDIIDTWDAGNKYAFYVGIQRGVMMLMNTLMLKYGGLSLEEFQTRTIKPPLNQFLALSNAVNMGGMLVKEVRQLAEVARTLAEQELEPEEKTDE